MSRQKKEREADAAARAQADRAVEATETDDDFVDADQTVESEEEPG